MIGNDVLDNGKPKPGPYRQFPAHFNPFESFKNLGKVFFGNPWACVGD
jgi:hypothetical protein